MRDSFEPMPGAKLACIQPTLPAVADRCCPIVARPGPGTGQQSRSFLMATVRLVSDDEATDAVRVVFDDIRATRGTDFINNFWRALAYDPELLHATWSRLKGVMGAGGAIDPLTKEMIYIAVSVANGCSYCVHSHTAAAEAKGMTPAQHGDLMAVIAMASQTNALATALQVPVDPEFQRGDHASNDSV